MIQRIIILLLAAMISLSTSIEAGLWDGVTSLFKKPVLKEAPTIRVLVATDREKIDLMVDGPFKIYDPNTGNLILLNKLGKHAFMEAMDGGLKWSEEFPGVHQLLIVPNSNDTLVTLDGVSYPGLLYLYEVEGKINAVNRVSIESYLCSVLSHLQNENLSKEMISAITITQRTNSIYLAENPINPFWHVDAKKVGYHGNADLSSLNPVNKVVYSTRNMVLSKTGTYEGIVTPFLAYWKVDNSNKPQLGVGSKISFEDAKRLADAGKNAAQLLHEAFPNSTIQLLRK